VCFKVKLYGNYLKLRFKANVCGYGLRITFKAKI
jgi:hypothetical protein